MDNLQISTGQFISPANQAFPQTRSVIISPESPPLVNSITGPQGAMAQSTLPLIKPEEMTQIKWDKIVNNSDRPASLGSYRSSKYQNKYSFKKNAYTTVVNK